MSETSDVQPVSHKPIVVYCDGLCEPRNPGGTATFGWVARRDGELVGSDCGVVAKGPSATNNLAEYTAIIEALRWLEANGFADERVVVRSDSQLAIRQLDGTYCVRSAAIRPLWQQASQLAKRFSLMCFEWVPRESNKEADELTRVAYAESRTADELNAEASRRASRAERLIGGVSARPDGRWSVRSSSGRSSYLVNLAEPHCNCPDFSRRSRFGDTSPCKHILAVRDRAGSTGRQGC